MNLYAIRDRLIDYFMDPLAAQNDYAAQDMVANLVNTEGGQNAITQAPHHFELWRTATCDDQGHINPSREFICDCSALIRAQRPATGPTSGTTPKTAPIRPGAPNGTGSAANAENQNPRHTMAREDAETAQEDQTPAGGNN